MNDSFLSHFPRSCDRGDEGIGGQRLCHLLHYILADDLGSGGRRGYWLEYAPAIRLVEALHSDIFSIPDADARDSAILHRAPDQLFSNSHHRSALLQLCRRFPDGADMWKVSIPFKAEETVEGRRDCLRIGYQTLPW